MASVVKTESGIDLLQRLSVRPKLLGLQVEIFGDNGPQPGKKSQKLYCNIKKLPL